MRSNSSIIFSISIALLSASALSNTLQKSSNDFDFSFTEGNHLNFNLGAEYGHTDNFLNQESDESDTSYQKLSLNSFMQAHTDHQLIQLSGNVNTYFFDEFSEDDHSDIDLRGKYFYKFGGDHTLFGSGSYTKLYEYRGTGLTKGDALSADKGDKYDDTLFNIGYRYGSFDSVSKVSALIGGTKLAYKTRESITNVLDNKSTFAHLSVDYLLSGKTYFSIATEYEDIEYDHAVGQDRDEIAALAGIKWEASNLSQLTLLLGYESISFEEELLDDRDTFKWRVSYDWHPIDQLKVRFNSGRNSDKSSSALTNYVLKDDYSLNATYAYSRFLSFNVALSYYDEETNFIDESVNEEYVLISSRFKYILNHWFSMYAKAQFETKDSDLFINEYDKATFNVGVNGIF